MATIWRCPNCGFDASLCPVGGTCPNCGSGLPVSGCGLCLMFIAFLVVFGGC